MKYAIIFLLFLASFHAKGQIYSFKQYKAAYVPLSASSSASINGDSTWSDDTTFIVPIGFNFRFMDSTYPVMRLLLANLLFENTYRSFSPLAGIVMQDRGLASGITRSPINYELSGSAPSRIMKIQWKNAGFDYDTASYANFQVWLYEGSGNIEARYGKCSVAPRLYQTMTGGPQVGIEAFYTAGTDSFTFLLRDNPDSAKVKSGTDSFASSLKATPKDSTVYLFTYQVINSVKKAEAASDGFMVFPNPACNYIRVISAPPGQVIIQNTTGQVVYNMYDPSGCMNIDVSAFQKGIYIVKLISKDGGAVSKIILQ